MTKLEQWRQVRKICLRDLKQKYTNLKDGQIADTIGISRPTFTRIKNETNHIPSPTNVLRLLKGSDNLNVIHDYADLIAGDLREILLNGEDEGRRKFVPNSNLEIMLKDELTFLAYELASSETGITKRSILKVLGDRGLKAIEELLKEEFLYENGGRYFTVDNGILSRSKADMKLQLAIYAKQYNHKLFGKLGNYMLGISEGLNKQGLQAVQDQFVKHYEALRAIYREPANKGESFSFAGGYCDVLNREL